MEYLVSVDIGTTTIRACLFAERCRLVTCVHEEVHLRVSGDDASELMVEMDPDLLFAQFVRVINKTLENIEPNAKVNIAICCQRNSFLFWDKVTGKTLTPIVCWNDGRSLKVCDEWNKSFILGAIHCFGAVLHFFTRTPRFAAAKMLQFLSAMVSHRAMVTIERSAELQAKMKKGELGFGCLDTWLLYQLSDGKYEVAEASNSSSTGMFDPYLGDYNFTILRLIGFPVRLLPRLVDSAGENLVPVERKFFDREAAVVAVVGVAFENVELQFTGQLIYLADQQAALYGAGCWKKYEIKVSLGTGLFVDMNTGDRTHASMNGLYPLVGWRVNGKDTFVAEGTDHDTATILQWAKNIGLFSDVKDTAQMAEQAGSSHGVVFIPGFGGLQTPVNDYAACCAFMGLKPDTTKDCMVRSILEAICFRVHQIVLTLKEEFGLKKLPRIRICGGVSQNNFVCQCIADLVGQPVERLADPGNVGCRGGALLAGFQLGKWDLAEMEPIVEVERIFHPNKANEEYLLKTYTVWLKALDRCRKFYV